MNNISNVLNDALLQTFFTFIGVGCVVSLLVGSWMLLKPDATLRLNQYFNRWFATEKLTTVLASQHTIDRVLHRYHRFVGVLVMGGSAYYLLYALLFAIKSKDLTNLLFHGWSEPLALWFATSLVVILVAGNVLAVVVGAGLLFRPDLIANLEAWANKSYESEMFQHALYAMRVHRRPLERHIRLVGVLVVAGSLYALASFWIVLQCPPLHC